MVLGLEAVYKSLTGVSGIENPVSRFWILQEDLISINFSFYDDRPSEGS